MGTAGAEAPATALPTKTHITRRRAAPEAMARARNYGHGALSVRVPMSWVLYARPVIERALSVAHYIANPFMASASSQVLRHSLAALVATIARDFGTSLFGMTKAIAQLSASRPVTPSRDGTAIIGALLGHKLHLLWPSVLLHLNDLLAFSIDRGLFRFWAPSIARTLTVEAFIALSSLPLLSKHTFHALIVGRQLGVRFCSQSQRLISPKLLAPPSPAGHHIPHATPVLVYVPKPLLHEQTNAFSSISHTQTDGTGRCPSTCCDHRWGLCYRLRPAGPDGQGRRRHRARRCCYSALLRAAHHDRSPLPCRVVHSQLAAWRPTIPPHLVVHRYASRVHAFIMHCAGCSTWSANTGTTACTFSMAEVYTQAHLFKSIYRAIVFSTGASGPIIRSPNGTYVAYRVAPDALQSRRGYSKRVSTAPSKRSLWRISSLLGRRERRKLSKYSSSIVPSRELRTEVSSFRRVDVRREHASNRRPTRSSLAL